MAANIFVDIAGTYEVTEGNIVSLCEFFRQDISRKTKMDIYTEPCVVHIKDDTLEIFSSKISFMFSPTTGILYKPYKTRRSEIDIFEECFDSNIRYVAQNYRKNASQVILALTSIFTMYFGDGNKGLRNIVSTLSRGLFDYEENQKGEYRFWYRKNDGDWVRSSLCRFTDYLYDLSKATLKYEQSDEYIISNIKNEHLGYFLITAADLMARSSGLRPII